MNLNRRNFSFLAASGLVAAAGSAEAQMVRRFHGGEFFASGTGTNLVTTDGFDAAGIPSGMLWSATTTGESRLSFHRGGSGVSRVRALSRIVALLAPQLQGRADLFRVEVATFSYQFEWDVTPHNRIVMIAKPGTWHGSVIEGPRAGHAYEVDVNADDRERPLMHGSLSPDGSALVMASPESVMVKESGTGGYYGRKEFAITAVAAAAA